MFDLREITPITVLGWDKYYPKYTFHNERRRKYFIIQKVFFFLIFSANTFYFNFRTCIEIIWIEKK